MAEPAPNKFASLRDGFAALRELILVLAMLALVIIPTTVRDVLSEAGIRSFAGVEFDEKTLEEVELAGSRVAELEQQLAMARQQLSSLSESSAVRADPKFGAVSRMLAEAQQKAAATSANLDEVKDQQTDLWIRAGRPQRSYQHESPDDPHAADLRQTLVPPEVLFNR